MSLLFSGSPGSRESWAKVAPVEKAIAKTKLKKRNIHVFLSNSNIFLCFIVLSIKINQ